MSQEIILTDKAAKPLGPYSQAIRAPPFIFVSGQIPIDAAGVLVDGDIGAKTRACCENLKAVLEGAGSGLEKVVKATVFILDMDNFKAVNAVYAEYFAHMPARSCIAVHQLPLGVPVEIEVVALA